MGTLDSRRATKTDEPFLFALFCSVRAEELGQANLSEAVLAPLLRAQYAGQRQTYAAAFRDAEQRVLFEEGRPVGTSLVSRTQAEIRLVDVALLPAHRGAGHGTSLLQALQEEARASHRPLRLSVHLSNAAARRLYARLGFEEVERSPTHIEMTWRTSR